MTMSESGISEEAAASDPPYEPEYIKVVVRCCSLKDRDLARGHKSIVETNTDLGDVKVTNSILPGSTPVDTKTFTFDDGVYDWTCVASGNQDLHDVYCAKQGDFYDGAIRDTVDRVLQGYNGTVLAYGQTGSGKSATMQGIKDNHELRGVIPRSCEHIFSHIAESTNQQYLVYVSYIQIHQERLMDLLSPDFLHSNIEIKEHPETGVYVKNLTSVVVKDIKEIEHFLQVGKRNGERWITHMSITSSRVTYIITVTVECSEVSDNGEHHVRVGRLNLVDMAGSERLTEQEKTKGGTLKEASSIGLSLSPFGSVISALVDKKSKHVPYRGSKLTRLLKGLGKVISALADEKNKLVPYRESKLTRLLKDSLGGSARTVMVACISPAWSNYSETISTLRYADRIRNIKNRLKVHVNPKYALVAKYRGDIERLKAELADASKAGENSGKACNKELGTVEIDELRMDKETPDRDEEENRTDHETPSIEVLAAKLQGMEDRLLSGGTSTEEQSLPQEEGQLIEVLKTDTQVLYICQTVRGI